MRKIILVILLLISVVFNANANALDFKDRFRIDMDMPIDIQVLKKYLSQLDETSKHYDKGYVSRYEIGKTFKNEFGRTIRTYGTSEMRLKKDYEDDLLNLIKLMPEETYQYIGPMLHEIPGMSEKILNYPGIKETKNQFPTDIAEKYKNMEGIEYLSPELYVFLMPDIWKERNIPNETPKLKPAQKTRKNIRIPDSLIGNVKTGAQTKKTEPEQKTMPSSERTIFPALTTPLTVKDAQAFLNTYDAVVEWGEKNNSKNTIELIYADMALKLMEKEKGVSLTESNLKDMVNPCQSVVLKIKMAGLYESFRNVVASEGFNPEQWAYTCDKTLKAFRIADADHKTGYAVNAHRQGLYDKYIDMLPKTWREDMYITEAAIVAMYTALKEDIKAVRPLKDEILKKIIKNEGMLLNVPVFY